MKSSESILKEEGIYLGQDTLGEIPCTIGYIKKFKWSWFATQLNTFIIIGNTNEPIDKTVIENFSKMCFEYSLQNNKGWPRGFQSVVGSICILQGNTIDKDAKEFCENLSLKHWSAFEIPMLYDLAKRQGIRYNKNPIWGVLFFEYFTERIDRIISKLS